MSGLFVSQPSFLFQDWPDLEWNQDSADRPGELLRPLTRSCFLLLVLGRLFLLALLGICLPSRWSPPFPPHALALISPLSPRCGSRPPWLSPPSWSGTLDWRLCSFFVLARAAPAFLPTALSVALRPLYSFQQAQYVQVFPLKPAPLCTLFAGLDNTIKSAIFLLFFCSLTLVLSSLPCPLLHLSSYFKLCGRSGRNCLLSPSVLLDCNGCPDTRFSRGTTRLMRWPDGVRYLRRVQSLVVSFLLLLVSTLSYLGLEAYSLIEVLWHTGSLNFHRGTCAPSHDRCVLSRLRCNGHSLLLGSYLSRIGRIENPSCSARGHSSQDTSHFILHCPATDSLCRSLFGDSLSLYVLGRPWGVVRLLGLHGLPSCPDPLEGVG